MSSYTNPYCKLLYIKTLIEDSELLDISDKKGEVVMKVQNELTPYDTALLICEAREVLQKIYNEIEDLPFEKQDLNLLVKLRRYIESYKDDDEIKAKYLKWFFNDNT